MSVDYQRRWSVRASIAGFGQDICDAWASEYCAGAERVDLAVVTDDREKMLIIIEIKGTDWDKIRADRVKRNVQRHIRQLLAYLDTAIGELEAGQWEGVAGALLYPSRPASAQSLACIEAAAAEQAIMLTWYDEVPWRL
jgi:hypothetical protein